MSKVRQVVRSFAIVALFMILAAPLGQILSVSPHAGIPAAVRQSAPNNVPLNLNVTLHGIGATFPAPLIFNWTTEYHEDYPNTTISYAAVGSGGGQSALFNKTSDFSASDAPLNSNQRLLAPNVLHIPETIGSVTLSYNLTAQGIGTGMNMTGALIAQIYLGTVHYWDDPAIKAINPGYAALLPHHNITTVHRSDGSGTTFVFTSFLSLDSSTWKTTVGANTAVTWPGSANGNPLPYYLTGNGNPGVANAIASNPFTFGYVELNYALQHKFTFANVQNPAGTYIVPTLQSTAYAVQNSTATLPQGKGDWSQVSILNANGPQTYPMASFTYLLVYPELNVVPSMDINESAQANALINFLSWVVHKGQTFAAGNYYVPLPASVVAIDDASIASIKFTIISTPLHDDISLSCSNSAGWSVTSLSAFSGDNVTLHLLSSDGNPHQFFVDFNNNGAIDQNETSTVSPVFSSTTVPVLFSFTPRILNPGSFPTVGGVFTFRDANNPTSAVGSFTLRRQQVAEVFKHANTFTSTLIPALDSSRVSIVGSLIADSRTGLSSGNITVVAVDKSSTGNNAPITLAKSYLLSGLAQGEVFILNAAVVPYDLGPLVTTGLTPSYTLPWRQLDFDADGKVNIVELATIGGSFGSTAGGLGYSGQADLNADGIVNIFDLVILASNFGFTPVFH